ncbi:GNAT family N-acetyltransferase [Thiolapillus sp.]
MTSFHIQPILPEQDEDMANIILAVGREFGAVGEGFGPGDAEVTQMSHHYPLPHSRYYTATLQGRVVGGGGIAPFAGSRETCELRKLFLLPEVRGKGIGRALAETCLRFARQAGYRYCYLDTLQSMQAAIGLYQSLGFRKLDHPLEGVVHHGCDVWMLKRL